MFKHPGVVIKPATEASPPIIALKCLKIVLADYLGQLELLKRDQPLERAMIDGEYAALPSDYASGVTRWKELRHAAVDLDMEIDDLTRSLHSGNADNLPAKLKTEMQRARTEAVQILNAGEWDNDRPSRPNIMPHSIRG